MPSVAEALQEALQRLRLMSGERGGGLVEDEHARLAIKRLGDLHQLPPPQGKLPDGSFQSFRQADPLASGPHPARQLGIVDKAGPPRICAQADVFGDREVA